MRFFKRLIADPLWLFLLAGLIIFGIHSLLQPSQTPAIMLTDETKARLVDERALLLGRPLSEDERIRVFREFTDREILFREALSQGMHHYDPRVRETLVERIRLGMVVGLAEPDEGELIDYYSSNLDLYKSEPEVSFDQFLFAEAPEDIDAMFALLAREPETERIGDARRRTFDRYGKSVLRALYNSDQLAQLETAEPGVWFGPIQGETGVVFLRVRERFAPRLIPYLDIRDQVRIDLAAMREQDAMEQAMQALRKKYNVPETP